VNTRDLKPEPGQFAELLRRARRIKRLTQAAAAARAGLSIHTWKALERGLRPRPRLDTLAALCTALDLSADQFIRTVHG